MQFFFYSFSVLAFLEVTSGARYVLTVPKQPIYDTNYTATVTAFNHQGTIQTVLLEYQFKNHVLNSTQLSFHNDDIQSWTVIFPWERMQELDIETFYLKMTVNMISKNLTLSFLKSSGFIFIQTDKPIYTPSQTVKFRVIALDAEQRLSKNQIKVEIKTKKDNEEITVDVWRYSAVDAFKHQEFQLPKDIQNGVWNICASIDRGDHKDSIFKSVSFEVKEYVLPDFSAELEVEPQLITKDTRVINLTVVAKDVYGRPVQGTVTMQIGTWSKQGPKLIYSVEEMQLDKGNCTVARETSALLPPQADEETTLYVVYNVTYNFTQERFMFTYNHSVFSDHFYQIDFSQSKHFFKPGLYYTLQAQAKSKLGNIASSKQINLTIAYVSGSNSKWESRQVNLDQYGKMFENISTSNGYTKIKFLARVVDEVHPTSKEYFFEVNTFIAREYITIYRVDTKKKDICDLVSLKYRATNDIKDHNIGTEIHKYLTVSVLSKGRIIYTTKVPRNDNGSSVIELPKNICPDLSPNYRIVAYYHTLDELVSDSLFVDTNPSCLDKIELPRGVTTLQVPFKPKDKYNLRITGSPGMLVGLLAVDKAVLMLNDKQTLTRQMIFKQLANHDQGEGVGDGVDSYFTLKKSGLEFLIFEVNTPMLSEPLLSDYQNIFAHEKPSSRMARPAHAALDNSQDLVTSPVDPAAETNQVHSQSVRNYFPESWLFEEKILPSSGVLQLPLILPDSMTTWSLTAVGLSANRGICMTDPLDIKVQTLFYLKVRAPYKVVRLEEINIKIDIYNYYNDDIQVIPLIVGDLKLKVNMSGNKIVNDIVRKTLHVVAEGQKVRKSVTFVLDPEAKHATFKPVRKNKKVKIVNTATLINVFDTKKKQQTTTIDLAMPQEVIPGTEFCRISAFGDLMGDIITHTVVQSKTLKTNLFSSAEGVLNDLGPTVHALIYLDQTHLMDEKLKSKGRRFIRYGITRLLKYKQGPAFLPQMDSKPATWLTVLVLKTLCHASAFTFVDQNLRDQGFKWLLKNVKQDGSMKEYNPRLQEKETLDSRLMLAAEVLIAFIQCNRSEKEDYVTLQAYTANFIEENLGKITQPLVLAKVTYALYLFNPQANSTKAAIETLRQKRIDKKGQTYWHSVKMRTEHSLWYQEEAEATSVEATAYALLVFLEHETQVNIDSIGEWLVAQRKPTGGFIGTVDSTVAIEALTKYSLKKYNSLIQVDLSCNVSSDKEAHHIHSFKFTKDNATQPGSRKNVPVGKLLKVVNEGKGFGQMHVIVDYNIPVNINKHCDFNISVQVTNPDYSSEQDSPKALLTNSLKLKKKKKPAIINKTRSPQQVALGKGGNKKRKGRSAVAVTHSRRRYKIYFCVRQLQGPNYESLILDVQMLTGFKPHLNNITALSKLEFITNAAYDDEKDVVSIQFQEARTERCFGFNILEDIESERLDPAIVSLKVNEHSVPSCSLEYQLPEDKESLKVFCADSSKINRGECRCFSGNCSRCQPDDVQTVDLHHIKQLVCSANVAYELHAEKVKKHVSWMEIEAKVLSVNKTGTHEIKSGDVITLMSKKSCSCFLNDLKNSSLYLLTTNVDRRVDSKGKILYHYVLDEKSTFIDVMEQGASGEGHVPDFILQEAFNSQNRC
ncbi:LOW QUALITY PROTEIN: alpha-2-macroglobulin-P-like [Physella acuta]|uniref:LOW QUALITY PROTEIN: alpha-2-macroglobulin-P-like n=1 Tax=Physella acuta TaxID=109671 RepID=UPI0027DD7C40|nr:LOW QUALITY PROTEIN: alpha-2-macroglobulin-P-like [Physella acuta]